MKNPLLKNKLLQEELEKKGFVSIPFLNEDSIQKLRDFYDDVHPNGAPEKIDGIHMTTWCEKLDYKKKISAFLNNVYSKPCKKIFQDFRTLNNVFIVKDSGDTPFKVHQDWTVVDERENFALNVWVPLYDVSKNEGGLWVVEGSHQIKRNVRGSAYLFPDYSPFYPELESAATSVSLKAGEAIIFYVNIIHGSPPNKSQNERIATCFSVIPKQAPLNIYFQKKKGDQLEVHSPEDDFVFQYDNLRVDTLEIPPSNKPIEIRESYINDPVTIEELKPFL